MQAAPEVLDYDDIKKRPNGLEGIRDAHHLHLWTLDGEYHLASVHLVVEESWDMGSLADLKSRARELLHDVGVEHATLELETGEEKDQHGKLPI